MPEVVVPKMISAVGFKSDVNIFEKFTKMIYTADPLSVITNIDIDELVPGMRQDINMQY